MFNRNYASVLAMLASISVLPFAACSDDAGSNPMPVAAGSPVIESSATESSSSEVVSNPVSSSSEAISSPKSSVV